MWLQQNPESSKPGAQIFVVLGLAAFWALCVALQYPRTATDDLWFLGYPFQVLDGHGLSNSFEARQGVPFSHFVAYPPLSLWISAGWMKLFGRTALALQCLWALSQFASSLAFGAMLRRFGLGRLAAAACAAAILLAANGTQGFRPEALATAFVMTGAYLALVRPERLARWAGMVLALLAPEMAPTFAVPVLLLLGVLVVYGRDRHGVMADLIGALAVAMVVGLFAIEFRLALFLHNFLLHALEKHKGIGGNVPISGSRTVLALAMIVVHAWGIWAAHVFLQRRHRESVNRQRLWLGLFMALSLIGTMMVHQRPASLIIPVAVIATVFLADLSQVLHARHKGWPQQALVFAFAALYLAGALYLSCGNFNFRAGPQTLALAERPLPPDRTLLVDGFTARFVYAYRLPPGVIDFRFQDPFPGTSPKVFGVRQGDIAFVPEFTLLRLYGMDLAQRQMDREIGLPLGGSVSTPTARKIRHLIETVFFAPYFDSWIFDAPVRQTPYCWIEGPLGAVPGAHPLKPAEFQALLRNSCRF